MCEPVVANIPRYTLIRKRVGSTLVAAHQLGRIGYGIKIDPGYVPVALERLSAFGLKPELRRGRSKSCHRSKWDAKGSVMEHDGDHTTIEQRVKAPERARRVFEFVKLGASYAAAGKEVGMSRSVAQRALLRVLPAGFTHGRT